MVQNICLNGYQHAAKILRDLKQMKCDGDLCDFTIQVDSDEYPTHKNILSAGSPYFKAMLKHDTTESRDGKVEMKEVDSECVKSCIDFLYSGNFNIPDGKISQLLHVAILMQLEEVKEAISDFLDRSLSPGNYYPTSYISKLYSLSSLSSRCQSYYQENILSLSTLSEFKLEPKSHVIDILKSTNVNLSAEEKLTVSLRWFEDKCEKNNELWELLTLIELNSVPLDFLRNLIENHPIISNDFRCYKLINAPLMEVVKKVTCESVHDLGGHASLVLFDRNSEHLHSFNPVTSEVTKFHGEDLLPYDQFSAISVDPYIYILSSDKCVHRLNFRENQSSWQQGHSMLADHGLRPPVVSLSGSLFVIGSGGGDEVVPNKFVEKFDPVADKWALLKGRPSAMADAAVVALDESIYSIGGWKKSIDCPSSSFCKFTPSLSKWEVLQPMKILKSNCGVAAGNRKIFLIGGYRGSSELKTVECYNVDSAQWTNLASTLNPHCGSRAHYVAGSIYLFGRSGKPDDVENYDVTNNRWSKVVIKGGSRLEVHETVAIEI